MTKNPNFPANPEEVLKSEKKFYENLHTRENVSKPAINELLKKIPSKKISNEHFILCEAEFL